MKYIKFLMLAIGLFALGAHAADPPAAATYRVLDDKLLVFGTNNNFQFKYDSSDNRLEIQDPAGNLLVRASDAGTTGVVGVKQVDVINGSYASQVTSGATANRAVTLPDAAGEISLLGQTISSSEITDGEIVNADINASAAIAATKLNAGTDGQVVVTSSSAAGWGTVPSAGITNGTILNEDINASAAIAVTKLSTSGASADYVLTYNGSAIVWAPAAGTGDIEAGANLGTDNLVPRMDGTGSDTLQGYTSNPITASDSGLLTVDGGINSEGVVEIDGGSLLLSNQSYLDYARDNELRWVVDYSTGTETGTSGETSLRFTAHDNDGNALREVMKLNRTASEGVVFGSNSAPSPIYVKGDIYAHTTDSQIVDDGKVLLTALAQTSATTGQSLVWDGTKWAPSSLAVNWGSPGAIGSVSPNSGVFTTLVASSATFSEAKITDDNRLILGTDSDIQIIYDEATDNRMEVSDGTNLLMALTDAGTTGNVNITGALTLGTALTDANVSDTLTIGASSTVSDSALSANVAHVNAVETIASNWVNTANPWADNEVADVLTIGSGSSVADAALSTNVVMAGDALTGDVATTFEADGSTVATIQANSVALTTDTTGNYVTSVATGTGLTGGAAASEGATLTLSLSHLGFQSLTDPNADRIAFWDDSAGTFAWLTAGSGLSISGTTMTASGSEYDYSSHVFMLEDFINQLNHFTSSNSGTSASAVFSDTADGTFTMESGTAASAYSLLVCGNYTGTVHRPFRMDNNLVFECRLTNTDLADEDALMIGFYYDQTPIGAHAISANARKLAFILVDDGSPVWTAHSSDGSASQTTDSAVGESSSPTTLKIVCTSTSAEYFVNGSSVATHSTNIPSSVNMYLAIQAYNIGGAVGESSMAIDYVKVTQDR